METLVEDSGLIKERATKEVQPSPTPAQYLEELHQQLTALQVQYTKVKSQLAQETHEAHQSISNSQTASLPTGLPLSNDPTHLIDDLVSIQSAQQYLQYLQDLQALSRHTEKLIRGAERAYSEGDPSIYLKGISDAVDAFSQGIGYVIALEQLLDASPIKSEVLQRHGAVVIHRVHAAGNTLRSLLSTVIQRRLQECSWPPPLIITGDNSSSQENTRVWDGFTQHEEIFNELQHLFIIQITLQRAADHKEFAKMTPESIEGPVLWIAEELAYGVATWLHHHFAQGLPTDRPDKPEWLFAASLKATLQCAPCAEIFRPCIAAHGMEAWYDMHDEMARGVLTAAVLPLLRSHVLPRLVTLQDPASWLHYADQAMRFEQNFSGLRGATALSSGPSSSSSALADGSGLACAHANSTLEVLFEDAQWIDAWLTAERADATRQIDGAIDAPDAWGRAPDAIAPGGGIDNPRDGSIDVTSAGDGHQTRASQHEFYPPAFCESILSVVISTVQRGGFIFDAKNKVKYTHGVVHASFKVFRGRMNAMLTRAEQFEHLLDAAGLPKVGAALGAIHYIEHSLREPQGTLLALVAGDDSLLSALERDAASLSSLRRQWAYKLAKLAVDRFNNQLNGYKRDFSLFIVHGEEGLYPTGPSPKLMPSADGLQALLKALSNHLDAVIFRDVWKAMALAVNYAIFNDVATEATFSRYGALQLEYDVNALVGVFSLCTSRPAAHFKESREACKLLCMSAEEANLLWQGLRQENSSSLNNDGSGGENVDAKESASSLLKKNGIRSLNAEQAASVLTRRVDLNIYI